MSRISCQFRAWNFWKGLQLASKLRERGLKEITKYITYQKNFDMKIKYSHRCSTPEGVLRRSKALQIITNWAIRSCTSQADQACKARVGAAGKV